MTTAGQSVLSALEALRVAYELISIDPADADTAVFCEKYGYRLEESANTLIVSSKKEPKKFAACIVLAPTRLDVDSRVRKLLGVSKASFASAAEMHALTGMEVGGVTPLALPPDLPLYIDGRVMHRDAVIVGGGGRDSKIRVSPEVFLKMGGVVVQDLARKRDDAVADELRSEPIENLPAGETVPLAEP